MDRYINLLFSGGLDSTLALLNYLDKGAPVRAITFDYGQKHREELNSATYILSQFPEVPRRRIVIPPGMLGHTSQLSGGGEGTSLETVQGAFIPFRNAYFLVIAANREYVTRETDGIIYLAVGSTASDHLPDQRQRFFEAMETALSLSLKEDAVYIATPNIFYTKAALIRGAFNRHWKRGIDINTIVANTHTCYEGWNPPCGKCHSCVERAEAFDAAGVIDTLIQ